MDELEIIDKLVQEFNLTHTKKDEDTLTYYVCKKFYNNINIQSLDTGFKSINALYDYGYMRGYKQAHSEHLEKENNIYDYVGRIGFLADNLDCVRISVKGNEDIIPGPEIIDNALFSIREALIKLVDDIRELV